MSAFYVFIVFLAKSSPAVVTVQNDQYWASHMCQDIKEYTGWDFCLLKSEGGPGKT